MSDTAGCSNRVETKGFYWICHYEGPQSQLCFTLGFTLQGRMASFKTMGINEVFSFLLIVC